MPFAYLTATASQGDAVFGGATTRVIQRPIDPPDLVDEVRALLNSPKSNELLGRTVGTHIRFVTHLAKDLPAVLAEPTAVAQVLLNLTLNAAQAMPDGGTLTIITSVAGEGHPRMPDAAGPFARLTIRDTGHGMTAETLQRAVEPFFTTRGRGLGSGLGLATVYGIVNQLGGDLHLASTPGRGAVVTIHLPTTERPLEVGPVVSAEGGGTETILVAEDEEGIRTGLTRNLTSAGYQVLVAANGADALALALAHPDSIELLLTDVVMPGMLGDELAATVHERRPDTKVLFMSGYAGDLMNRYGVLEPGVTVLPKPFTTTELLIAVRAWIGVAAL